MSTSLEYFLCTFIDGCILAFGIWSAIRTHRTVTAAVLLTLFALNILLSSATDSESSWIQCSLEAMLVARKYLIVADLTLLVACFGQDWYSFPALNDASVDVARNPAADERLKRICLNCSLIAAAANIGAIVVAGGVSSRWSRSWSQNMDETLSSTYLTALSNLLVFYPYALYYLHQVGGIVTWRDLYIVGFIGSVTLPLFLIGGTTTYPLTMALPLGLRFIRPQYRISLSRIVLLGVICAVGITGLRFARHAGAMCQGDIGRIDIANAIATFGDSDVSTHKAFPIYATYAMVVEYIDSGSPMLCGKSYLASVLGLLPGRLFPGKTEFVNDYRADSYTAVNFSMYGEKAGWAPSGWYGEAYLNFGFVGLLAASLLFGVLMRFIDNLPPRAAIGYLPDADFFGPIVGAVFIGLCRQTMFWAVLFWVTQIGLFICVFSIIVFISSPLPINVGTTFEDDDDMDDEETDEFDR